MKQQKRKPGASDTALNIRDFPADLLWACKGKAALQRQGLREFVIDVLRQATADVKLAT